MSTMTSRTDGEPRILALWSAPRSRSTAFFRMMIERADRTALHEPFSTRAEQGIALVGERRAASELEVIDAIRDLSRQGPIFFKDTTDERYPAVLADRRFLADDVRHTFVVRHPAETIASYYAISPEVRRDQIGFEHLHELFVAVREATGRTPPVMDADDLVSAPGRTVERYCAALSIPFRPQALSWAAGERAEWRTTGRWHADVSRSTSLGAHPRSHQVVLADHPHLEAYLAHHLPFYERLREHRLAP
jgi:hypothetical protein